MDEPEPPAIIMAEEIAEPGSENAPPAEVKAALAEATEDEHPKDDQAEDQAADSQGEEPKGEAEEEAD